MISHQELSDRMEIQNILALYCEAIDNRDWEALDDFFTEDAIIDYTATGGLKCTLPEAKEYLDRACLLYTSPSPRDRTRSRMPSSA